jgi:hypothetical protein
MRSLSIILVLVFLTFPISADEFFEQGRVLDNMGNILSHRDRIKPINRVVKNRFENLLPKLMRETDLDMWIVINREYVEDELFYTLVPQPTFAARRTTILVFFDKGEGKGLERITVSRYPINGYYESKWQGGTLEQQWERLAEIIVERNPKKIAINTSKNWTFSDGLTVGLHRELLKQLPEKFQKRLTSAENLVVRWMETRTEEELEYYPHIVAIARRVIEEAFSNRVITPGITTTKDVQWYIIDRFRALQLKPWFMPDVNVQRQGDKNLASSPFYGSDDRVIQQGDILHTDVGFCYLRLCTDTQEMGYVLKMGETDIPKGLAIALAKGNLWQDLLTREFKTGRTGNQILARSLKANKKAGLVAATYTHPIGFVGHAAGPTIGMWDNQGDTPVLGDWKLNVNTAYAIEGNIKFELPEWENEWIQIKLEQTAVFEGNKVYYLAGRQTKWHLVR